MFSQPLIYSLPWFHKLQFSNISIVLLPLCSWTWTFSKSLSFSLFFSTLIPTKSHIYFQHQLSPICRHWKMFKRLQAVFQTLCWTFSLGSCPSLRTWCILPLCSQTPTCPCPSRIHLPVSVNGSPAPLLRLQNSHSHRHFPAVPHPSLPPSSQFSSTQVLPMWHLNC